MKLNNMRRLAAAFSGMAILGATIATSGTAALATQGHTMPWGLHSCKAVVAAVPVSKEAMQKAIDKYLPNHGFEPTVPPDIASKSPDPRAASYLGLEGVKCSAGIGMNGQRLTNVDWSSVFTFIKKPKEAALNDVDRRYYFVKFATLVNDQPRLDYLARQGVSAQPGNVAFNGPLDGPAGPTVASVTFCKDACTDGGKRDIYSFKAITAINVKTLMDPSGKDTRGVSGTFAAFTPARNGLAVWRAHWGEGLAFAGAGSVQMSEGSLGASIVGDTLASTTAGMAGDPPLAVRGNTVAQALYFASTGANYSWAGQYPDAPSPDDPGGSFTLLDSVKLTP